MGHNNAPGTGKIFRCILLTATCILVLGQPDFVNQYGERSPTQEGPRAFLAQTPEASSYSSPYSAANLRDRPTPRGFASTEGNWSSTRTSFCINSASESTSYSGSHARPCALEMWMRTPKQRCLCLLRKVWTSVVGHRGFPGVPDGRSSNTMAKSAAMDEPTIAEGPKKAPAHAVGGRQETPAEAEGWGQSRRQRHGTGRSTSRATEANCSKPSAGNGQFCGSAFRSRATAWITADSTAKPARQPPSGSASSYRRDSPNQCRARGQRPPSCCQHAAEGQARARQAGSATVDCMLHVGRISAEGHGDSEQAAAGPRKGTQSHRRSRDLLATELADCVSRTRKVHRAEAGRGGGRCHVVGSCQSMGGFGRYKTTGAARAAETAYVVAEISFRNSSQHGIGGHARQFPNAQKEAPSGGAHRILAGAEPGQEGEGRARASKVGGILDRIVRKAAFYVGLWGCFSEHHRPLDIEAGTWTYASLQAHEYENYVPENDARVLGLQLELATALEDFSSRAANLWADPRIDDDPLSHDLYGDAVLGQESAVFGSEVADNVHRNRDSSKDTVQSHNVHRPCLKRLDKEPNINGPPKFTGRRVHFAFETAFWFPAEWQIELPRAHSPKPCGHSKLQLCEKQTGIASIASSSYHALPAAPPTSGVEHNPFAPPMEPILAFCPCPQLTGGSCRPWAGGRVVFPESAACVNRSLQNSVDVQAPPIWTTFCTHIPQSPGVSYRPWAEGFGHTDPNMLGLSHIAKEIVEVLTTPGSEAHRKRPKLASKFGHPDQADSSSKDRLFPPSESMHAYCPVPYAEFEAAKEVRHSYTSFDKLSQARVYPRRDDMDPVHCIQEATQRSSVLQPFGRLLTTQVEDYPGPQVMVQSFETFATHRAVAVVCRSCDPNVWVSEYPFGMSIRTFLFGLVSKGQHPWQEIMDDMLSYTCTVDERPYSCTQALPADADVVQIYQKPPVAAAHTQALQDTLPIVGLPISVPPAVNQEPIEALTGPSVRISPRPPVPPLPSSRGRRWSRPNTAAAADTQLQSHSEGRAQVHVEAAFNGAGSTFVLFDEFLHMRVLPLPSGASAHDLVQLAYDQTVQLPFPRSHRFLHHAIPGLPIVQLCIWGGLEIGDIVLPFLTQDAGRPVCTTRVSKASTAFEGALAVEEACGFGSFLHEGVNRRQIHLAINGSPVQPHARWVFQFADYAGFSIGPVPGHLAPQPHSR